MEEKYYSPELQEFHYDFEYELFDPVLKRWCKFTFDEQDKLSFIKVNKSRVKLLDKVDIESLGWKQEHWLQTENIALTFKKEDYELILWFGEIPTVEITREEHDIQFHGEIKNKSELKKLMSQLKIKHE